MRRLSGSWRWAALFGAALAVGLVAGTDTKADSPVPSVTNPGPQGAQVLHTWLAETGGKVETISGPLTALPAGVQGVVVAAPTERRVSEEEVAALDGFVEGGGTLIYLSPRPAGLQPLMRDWLSLIDSQVVLPNDAHLGDLGGTTVDVGPEPSGLLSGIKQLRVLADSGLEVAHPNAVAVAGKALWRIPMGKGQVWVSAGPDLLQNRRLDLHDNLQLWVNLRSLKLGFDEFHHRAAAAPRWSPNLLATLFQFIFVALLFVAARAPRLGPPRPTLARVHRSSLEYVRSMGALMRRAGVENELKLKLRDRLRRLMQERLGIALTIGADEASRMLAQQTHIAPDAFLKLDQRLAGDAGDFVVAAGEAARLEDLIVGRNGQA